MKKLLWIGLALLLAAGGWWFASRKSDEVAGAAKRFRTAKVERGELVEGVQASGTVQPVVLVQVGTQVSGVVQKLFVDFNSKVKEGDVVAQLDTRRMEAQLAQDEASVARARADVERLRAALAQSRAEVERVKAAGTQAQADVARGRALATQAEKDLARQKSLAERQLVAPSELDASVANQASLDAQLASAQAAVQLNAAQLASAQAAVEQATAQVAVGEASIRQAEAQLQGDRVNLDYARIVSPIDGVVVSRNVDVGQTVAASLQAPTLFVIAKDLTQVQVQASVPEADIGKLHEGQRAHFTVDAHPDHGFDGTVSQVRLASTTVQNVVTYTVLVDATNPQGLLLPGMTANVTFEIQRSAADVLHVPNAALRFTPPSELVAAEARPAGEEGGRKKSGGDDAGGGNAGRSGRSVVWIEGPEHKLVAIPVRAGLSDGVRTVVEPLVAGALAEGTEILTAVLASDAPATTNPFAPPAMGGARGTGMRR